MSNWSVDTLEGEDQIRRMVSLTDPGDRGWGQMRDSQDWNRRMTRGGGG